MPSRKQSTKPPYRVPSMIEVAKIPWNGFTVASTFSGCGGSSLGYRMAGFKVIWASEFIEAARDSYRANMRPGTILDERDIREVTPQMFFKTTGLKAGELDLLDGSPPCASFSTAGKRQKGWGEVKKYSDKKQRTDDLFFEFVRLLRGIEPKVFVAENVSGLVKGTAKGYFLEILKELKASGYRVTCKVLDAQWLGVPQQRQRTIFVGVREDLKDVETGKLLIPCHPSPLSYRYSVREAIPWISGLKHDSMGLEGSRVFDVDNEPMASERTPGGGANTRYEVSEDTFNEHRVTTDKPAPSIRAKKAGHLNVTSEGPDGVKTPVNLDGPSPNGRAGSKNRNRTDQFQISEIPPVEPEADMSKYATGREWGKIVPGDNDESKFSQLVRPRLDEACPTITQRGGDASCASVTHPIERRKFSIAELKRICAFPDDFILTGSYAQQWERLGRAVPPLMMRAIAETVRDGVLVPADGLRVVAIGVAAEMRKPLLIGQSPSKLTDPREDRRAFTGLSGERLAAILGVSLGKLLSSVEAVNLLDRYRGRLEDGFKGDDFPIEEAKLAASRVNLAGRGAILAGRGVASAFGVEGKYLETMKFGGGRVLIIPHPSGINSWWNGPANVSKAVAVLKKFIWGNEKSRIE